MTTPQFRFRVVGPGDPGAGRVLELEGPSVLIGRSRRAQLRLPDHDVSAAHARVFWADGQVRAEDLGSVNGTRAGDEVLVPGTTYPVDYNQTLHIADYRVVVLDPAHAPGGLSGEAGTATLAAHLARDLAGGRDAARLRVRDPAGAEHVVELVGGERLRLGRDRRCTLRLDDPDLSREHAELHMAPDGAVLTDLGSKNGISVNGEPWTTPRPLRHGDHLVFGGCQAWYEDPAEALLAALNDEEPGAPEPTATKPLSAADSEPPVEPTGSATPAAPQTGPVGARPSPASGRLARLLLLGLGLALMGAAAFLLIWLFW